MQETTDWSDGREEKASRSSAKLRILKGTKLIDRDTLTSKLWRQASDVELYLKYFKRDLGLLSMTKDQMSEADRVRDTFSNIVDEPFTPQVNGQDHWPFTLGLVDIMKMAWAIHIDQRKILVMKNGQI